MAPRRVPSSKRRSRRSQGLPAWLPRAIGGLVAVGGFVAFAVFLYTTLENRWNEISEYLDPGNRFDLSYLPPNADGYILLRASALRRAGSVDAFIESARFRQELEPTWELLGLRPDNIETATYGAVGFGRQLNAILEGRAAAPGFVTVIRTVQPIEEISVHPPFAAGEQVPVGQRSYVRIQAPSDEDPDRMLGLFAPDAKTIVFGTEDYVRNAVESLEQGMPPARREELDFVNPEQHLLIVALSSTVPETSPEAVSSRTGPFPQSFVDLMGTVDRMPDSYSLGLAFNGDELRIEAICRFAGGGQQAACVARIEEVTGAAREELAAALAERGVGAGAMDHWELLSAGERSLKKLRIAAETDSVTVSTAVPTEHWTRRNLQRSHALSMVPFSLALERAPKLMLGGASATDD